MATEYRAADLPDGSVAATKNAAWIKELATEHMLYPWRGTNGGRFANDRIDRALADGAQVLRVGTGEDGTGAG